MPGQLELTRQETLFLFLIFVLGALQVYWKTEPESPVHQPRLEYLHPRSEVKVQP